jgi:hypothetical protein
MLRSLAVFTCLLAFATVTTACSLEPDEAAPTDEVTAPISSCPQLSPPGEHFCQDGTIVVVKDERGCPFYTCQR